MAQGTGRRAQGAGHRAQSAGHRAQGTELSDRSCKSCRSCGLAVSSKAAYRL